MKRDEAAVRAGATVNMLNYINIRVDNDRVRVLELERELHWHELEWAEDMIMRIENIILVEAWCVIARLEAAVEKVVVAEDGSEGEKKKADLSRLSSLLYRLHLALDDYVNAETMIEATEIILNYKLD